MKHASAILCAVVTAPLFCGCAATPPVSEPAPPAISSFDAVMQAQYKAGKTQGALTGEEASEIYRHYQTKIGAATTATQAPAAGTQTSTSN